MNRSSLIVAVTLVTAGCLRAAEYSRTDVMSGATLPDAVFATTECTVKNEFGTCNVKTCKKDEKSDCTNFAKACLETGRHYSGTGEGGT